MRRVTWRTWAVLAACAAAYAAAGYWLAGNGTVEEWLYRVGLTVAAVIPLLYTGIYTALGLAGLARWWTNSLGTALVIAALTVVLWAAPLAWVFWFDGGMLTVSWLAWIEVSGPAVSALAWLWVCWTWTRLRMLTRVTDPDR